MSTPRISIIVAPREQFSVSERALSALLELTEGPYELVYVDGRSPDAVRDYLRNAAREHDFTLLRHERYLTPNAARNIGVAAASGDVLVFIDNDLIVSAGWLESLVDAATETGAWAVGPLYLEGEPSARVIHMAGGRCHFSGERPNREFHTDHILQHVGLDDLEQPLERSRCDFVEFHCLLLTRHAWETLGPFDEKLLNTREHIDLCLGIDEAGGEVWFEPGAQVTYKSPPPLARADLPYFLLRWSEQWTRSSLRHFIDKYGLAAEYEERAAIAAARRSLVIKPLSDSAGRMLGGTVGAFVHRAGSRVEQLVNRLWVRRSRLSAASSRAVSE